MFPTFFGLPPICSRQVIDFDLLGSVPKQTSSPSAAREGGSCGRKSEAGSHANVAFARDYWLLGLGAFKRLKRVYASLQRKQ